MPIWPQFSHTSILLLIRAIILNYNFWFTVESKINKEIDSSRFKRQKKKRWEGENIWIWNFIVAVRSHRDKKSEWKRVRFFFFFCSRWSQGRILFNSSFNYIFNTLPLQVFIDLFFKFVSGSHVYNMEILLNLWKEIEKKLLNETVKWHHQISYEFFG